MTSQSFGQTEKMKKAQTIGQSTKKKRFPSLGKRVDDTLRFWRAGRNEKERK